MRVEQSTSLGNPTDMTETARFSLRERATQSAAGSGLNAPSNVNVHAEIPKVPEPECPSPIPECPKPKPECPKPKPGCGCPELNELMMSWYMDFWMNAPEEETGIVPLSIVV